MCRWGSIAEHSGGEYKSQNPTGAGEAGPACSVSHKPKLEDPSRTYPWPTLLWEKVPLETTVLLFTCVVSAGFSPELPPSHLSWVGAPANSLLLPTWGCS